MMANENMIYHNGAWYGRDGSGGPAMLSTDPLTGTQSLVGPGGVIPIPMRSDKFDGAAIYDATIGITDAGITAVSSPSALFRQSDVGKVAMYREKVQTATKFGNGIILSVSGDGLTAYCAMYASVAAQITPTTFVYGSDVTAFLVEQIAIAKTGQRSLQLPPGIACVTDRFTVSMGVDLVGRGRNKAIGSSAEWAYMGTSLVLCKAVAGINNNFIKLSNGVDVYGSQELAHNKPQSGLYDLNVDANFSAFYGVEMRGGFGNEIERVSIARPANVSAAGACVAAGNSSRIYNSFLDAHSAGMCAELAAMSDVKVKDNWLASPAATAYCAKISGCTDVQYHGNHSFRNGASPGAGGQVKVESFSGANSQLISVKANVFDTSQGPHVYVTVTGGSNAQGVTVDDNICMQNDSIAPNLYPAFEVNVAASSTLTGLRITNNEGISSFATTSQGVYSALLKTTNAGTIYGDNVSDNTLLRSNLIFDGRVPETHGRNIIRVGTSSVVKRCENSGRFTSNGTGAQTAFSFPHGLDGVPATIVVGAGAVGAVGDSYASADATNITVTYSTAPASGTGNVVINWTAKL